MPEDVLADVLRRSFAEQKAHCRNPVNRDVAGDSVSIAVL